MSSEKGSTTITVRPAVVQILRQLQRLQFRPSLTNTVEAAILAVARQQGIPIDDALDPNPTEMSREQDDTTGR